MYGNRIALFPTGRRRAVARGERTMRRASDLPADLRARRDEVLERFEDAWNAGRPSDLTALLPDEPALRAAVLPGLVEIDFERRLKAGEDVRVESYTGRFPELASLPQLVLDLAVSEYRFRRQGRAGLRRELLERFPTHRAELEARLPRPVLEPTLVDPKGSPDLPRRLGRYELRREVGAGQMGTVYEAYDTLLLRRVALKVPQPAAADRTLREARAVAHIHHPNICPVYEAGTLDGVPYLTMLFVEGVPLSERLSAGPPFEPRAAAALVRTLALALHHAHEQGVVHRDLKPANIMLDARGVPVITDFGIARRRLPDEVRHTLPGTLLGSPAYMSPEQVEGNPDAIGPASDQWSLGVIFYELLTGRLPFRGSSLGTVWAQIREVDPEPPAQVRPGLDPGLEALCKKALAKPIPDRFPSLAAFADALGAWLEARPAGAPGGPGVSPGPVPPPDPRAAREAQEVLRAWGWDMGLRKLKAEAERTGDESRKATLRVLLGWLAGERGHYAEALPHLQAVAGSALAGWALAGQALVAVRERRTEEARRLLDEAARAAEPGDVSLRATVAHLRATLAFHGGASAEALALLCAALEGFGPDHFGTGRVLDTFGMVHAARDDFPTARAFYEASLRAKEKHGDEAGVALTYGQLGRLHLDWDLPEEADACFRKGLELARRIGDERGEAQVHNHRGQVFLALGRPAEALPLLDESVRSAAGRFTILEAYARKDRALAHLALGDADAADADCNEAERLFEAASFAEGMGHVQRLRGLVRMSQGQAGEAARAVQAAAASFEGRGLHAEAARAYRDLARVRQADVRGASLARDALETALTLARRGRRPRLASLIEGELEKLGRPSGSVRARAVPDLGDAPAPAEESATVLAVRLARGGPDADAPDLLAARNHLYADLAALLEAGGVVVDQYQGEGLIAVARGADHAARAVAAALAAVRAVAEVNCPRRTLGWPMWQAWAALASGPVYRGGVGTFERCDTLTTGAAVRLACGLLAEAEPGLPCLAEETRRLVGERFAYRAGSPRTVAPKPWGPRRVWDATGPGAGGPQAVASGTSSSGFSSTSITPSNS
jgi:tetratricopeptide (TPR) repeat protein